jgi:hypothetical protein
MGASIIQENVPNVYRIAKNVQILFNAKNVLNILN